MADIFISYARADRARIEDLGSWLGKAGYTVWWDRQIVGGEDFYEAIERELAAAKIVVVAWSQESSKSRWVKDEAGVAAEAGKIIALSLDGSEPPIGFKQFHAIDGTDDDEVVREELVRAIKAKLEGVNAPAASSSRQKTNKQSKRPRGLVLAGIAGALLIGAGWIAYNNTEASRSISDNLSRAERLAAPEKSIAVLPFVDMSANGDQDYFSEGVSEEILNALVRVPDLKVAGRTSSFYFKDKNIDLREIGEALDVAHILEGSVRTQGDKVRITAQLIRAADGYHLWSDTYDGTLDDIFDLQETISRAITNELEIILGEQAGSRLAIGLTQNRDAHDWFLQGRNLSLSSFKAEDLYEARQMLQRAVKLDPDFAAAWSELVRVNGQIAAFVVSSSAEESLESVEFAARQALRAEPELGMSQLAMQRYHRYSNQLAQATSYGRAAFELEPENSEINGVLGDHFAYLGRTRDAMPFLQRASELDPMRTDPWVFLSVTRNIEGDLAGAERAAKRAIELGNVGGYAALSDALYLNGEMQEAADVMMDFREAILDQLPENLRVKELWEGAARAYYLDNDAAVGNMRSLATLIMESEELQINAFFLGLLARTYMFDEMFEYWGRGGGTNAVLGASLWGDMDWAKAARAHPGFAKFAEENGFLEEWQANGWPDKCRPLDADKATFTCN